MVARLHDRSELSLWQAGTSMQWADCCHLDMAGYLPNEVPTACRYSTPALCRFPPAPDNGGEDNEASGRFDLSPIIGGRRESAILTVGSSTRPRSLSSFG